MNAKSVKDELKNILQGTSDNCQETLVQTIACYLRASQRTSTLVENDKQIREKETKSLIEYCNQNHLWYNDKIDVNLFISEGAEQKVYIKDNKTVYKLNDAIYYTKWLDYFNSLLLNNYFFPDTSYTLVGFCLIDEILYAVVEQPFVKATHPTDLNKVKEFMAANGFKNTRNNDYYNADLGIILEDLHDENVLVQEDVLYFIDTVFYIK
jgi:hypothetical protein